MKPPEEARRELVARWVAKAEDDWRLCHRLMTDSESYAEATTFHAQQAVEKYLKAFLTWQQRADAVDAVATADRVRNRLRKRLPVGEMEGRPDDG